MIVKVPGRARVSAIISARSQKAERVSQIPAHAEHEDDLLVKVPALEESCPFSFSASSALSFDRFANDYAVSKRFPPEP